jgi:hypothetical protein
MERELRDLESRLREKESQLRLLQASAKAVQQKAQHDAFDLDAQSQALEKRHIKEINGLAKQIQFLRARCSRAESFREALGYQKRFFLMQIQTYNEWYVPGHIPLFFLANTIAATKRTSTSSRRWVSHPISLCTNAVPSSSQRHWLSSRH